MSKTAPVDKILCPYYRAYLEQQMKAKTPNTTPTKANPPEVHREAGLNTKDGVFTTKSGHSFKLLSHTSPAKKVVVKPTHTDPRIARTDATIKATLLKNKEWVSTTELSEKSGLSWPAVKDSLVRFAKTGKLMTMTSGNRTFYKYKY